MSTTKDDLEVLGLEAIKTHSSSASITELKDVINSLRTKPTNVRAEESDFARVMQDITGLKFRLKFDDMIGLEVDFSGSIKDHPIYLAQESAKIKNGKDYKRVLNVNLSEGIVAGTVTDYSHTVRMSENLIKKSSPFDTEEIVALVLKEAGFLLAFYDMTTRTGYMNEVMGSLMPAIMKGKDEQAAMIMKDIKARGYMREGSDEILATRDQSALKALILNAFVSKSMEDLGANIFSPEGWETVSVDYTETLGLGKELSRANKRYSQLNWRRKLTNFLSYAIRIVIMFFQLVLSAGLIFAFVSQTLGILVAVIIVSFTFKDIADMTALESLIQRRKEMIGKLRDVVDAETKRRLLEEIEALDDAAKAAEKEPDLFNYIKSNFTGRSRARKIKASNLLKDFKVSELGLTAATLDLL